ncbi:MAG: hypothetical protein IPM82_01355 [Saprospiraceae bacterium]|nr:hypothetical protein [Saprospiraceae bacterium]
MTGDKITRKYVQGFPPTLVIEIDLDVELEGTGLKTSEDFLKFRTKTCSNTAFSVSSGF